MMGRWRDARKETEEINLIPVMNLMVTLIPFLLFGAVFMFLTTIPASVLSLSDDMSSAANTEENKSKLVLTLSVKASGMDLIGKWDQLDEAALNQVKASFPNQSGTQALAALIEHLKAVKAKYPTSDTIILESHDKLTYSGMVAIMDAVRKGKLPGRVKGTALDKAPPPLYPKIVLTRKNTVEDIQRGLEDDEAGEDGVDSEDAEGGE